MWKRISDRLHQVSNGWVALSALAIFLLFSALILPGQAANAESDTGSAESPDTSFYYSAGDLYRMAEVYGEQGRQAYVRARFTFDVIWPLVYTIFLSTAISWIRTPSPKTTTASVPVVLLPRKSLEVKVSIRMGTRGARNRGPQLMEALHMPNAHISRK